MDKTKFNWYLIEPIMNVSRCYNKLYINKELHAKWQKENLVVDNIIQCVTNHKETKRV